MCRFGAGSSRTSGVLAPVFSVKQEMSPSAKGDRRDVGGFRIAARI